MNAKRAHERFILVVVMAIEVALMVGFLVPDAFGANFTLGLDTAAFSGTGRLEFDLLAFDDLDGNNTAVVTSPRFAPEVSLTDPGTAFRDLTLGGSIPLFISATSNLDASLGDLGGPDELRIFLLDPDTNFTKVDTNLDGDALAIFRLLGAGRIDVLLASSTQPGLPVTAVPEPGTLALLSGGLSCLFAVTVGRRVRGRQ